MANLSARDRLWRVNIWCIMAAQNADWYHRLRTLYNGSRCCWQDRRAGSNGAIHPGDRAISFWTCQPEASIDRAFSCSIPILAQDPPSPAPVRGSLKH